MAPDARGDDAPDLAVVLANRQRGIVRVLGCEMPLPRDPFQAFDGQLAVENGNDDVVRLRADPAIDDQQIAIEYPGIAHRFPGGADEERGCGPADQMLIEVELALDMIVRRTGKARRNLRSEQR